MDACASLALVCEWTESESLRSPRTWQSRRECAPRAPSGMRTRSCGAVTAICSTTSTTSATRTPRTGHPRNRPCASALRQFPGRGRGRGRRPCRATSASRARRAWRRLSFAVDELSGFITACALVPPDRVLQVFTPKSVKKKLKAAQLRRRPSTAMLAPTPAPRGPRRRLRRARVPCHRRDGGARSRARPRPRARVSEPPRIVVLEGDQTGQELLEEALRVLDSEVTGLGRAGALRPLAERRRRRRKRGSNEAARRDEGAARAQAATITPESTDDVAAQRDRARGRSTAR